MKLQQRSRSFVPICLVMITLPRLSAQFSTEWMTTYNNLSGYNSAEDLLVLPSGSVVSNGTFTTGTTSEAYIAAFASDGTDLWNAGLPDSIGRAWKIFRLNDGTLLSLGDFENMSGTNDVIAQHVDTLGNLLGNIVLNTPGFATGDDFADATQDAFGNVYLAGSFMNGAQVRPGLARINGNGQLDWWVTYPIPSNWGGFGKAIAVEVIGDTLPVIWTRNATSYSAAIAFNTSGQHQWTTDLTMATTDNNNGMTCDGLGHAIVGGNRNQFFHVSKLDAAGNVVWSKDLSYPGLTSTTGHIVHVRCDAAGDIYAVGEGSYQLSIPGPYYLLAKLSSAGTVLWTDTLTGGAINFCSNMDFAELHEDRWTVITSYLHTLIYEYDTTGLRMFRQDWNVPGAPISNVNAIRSDGAGGLYLAGRARLAGSAGDGFVAKLVPLSTALDGKPQAAVNTSPFPIPTDGELIIPACSGYDRAVVLDLNGRIVLRTTTSGRLDVSGLAPGSYVLQLGRSGARWRFVKG